MGKTIDEAGIWEELYLKNFGYRIDTAVFLKTLKSIPLYLIRIHNKYIGTAMTFQTTDVIGIYSLGVIQDYRRKGYAEETLAILLNEAVDSNIPWLYYKLQQWEKISIPKWVFMRTF